MASTPAGPAYLSPGRRALEGRSVSRSSTLWTPPPVKPRASLPTPNASPNLDTPTRPYPSQLQEPFALVRQAGLDASTALRALEGRAQVQVAKLDPSTTASRTSIHPTSHHRDKTPYSSRLQAICPPIKCPFLGDRGDRDGVTSSFASYISFRVSYVRSGRGSCRNCARTWTGNHTSSVRFGQGGSRVLGTRDAGGLGREVRTRRVIATPTHPQHDRRCRCGRIPRPERRIGLSTSKGPSERARHSLCLESCYFSAG